MLRFGVLRCRYIQQLRYKTWFNIKNQPIEDLPESLKSLKYYVRSNDVPKTFKKKIIKENLLKYFEEPKLNPDNTKIVNQAFTELYKLNGNIIDDNLFTLAELTNLFQKSSASLLLSTNERLRIPTYMSLLISHLLKQDNIPPYVMVYLVDLGSTMTSFNSILNSLVKYKDLEPEYINAMLLHYMEKGTLDLEMFEEFASTLKINSLDEQFYVYFNKYIESLFNDIFPEVHEYKDLNKNIYRIQGLLIQMLKNLQLENTSSKSIVTLLKLSYELISVFENERLLIEMNRVLQFVSQDSKQIDLLTYEIFQQDSEDESLSEVLLSLTWRQYPNVAQLISDMITSDTIRFSPVLRFQSDVYLKLHELQDKSELEKYEAIFPLISISELNKTELFNRTIQAAMISQAVAPRGYFTQTLSNHFGESTVLSYKYRIDSAIDSNDYVQAINIFDDSVSNLVSWSSDLDPSISKTLNDLIIVICNNLGDITTIFPIFTKIKQQMSSACNVDAITAMSRKILQAEFASDMIEMLKRELPEIRKDSRQKIPLLQNWTVKYQELFTLLHSYVITYEKDLTFETNWVIYGELQKYFHVPFDSYLPTMKFFCDHGSPNSALIIFHQLKKLNELHGTHNNLPPLREIYMYLFQQFGDKLYEDGVIDIHEYLKMDLNLPQQDLQLQNSILNAYSNLQDVARARELFLSMSTNPEGLNEETIQIMIKTYTYHDVAYVQHFWNNLSQFGIKPNEAIYKQYLIAHVYHGLVDKAIALTEGMADYDLELKADTLLSLHNFSLEKHNQKKILEWAETKHKDLWNEAISTGLLTGATDYVPSDNLIAGTTNSERGEL